MGFGAPLNTFPEGLGGERGGGHQPVIGRSRCPARRAQKADVSKSGPDRGGVERSWGAITRGVTPFFTSFSSKKGRVPSGSTGRVGMVGQRSFRHPCHLPRLTLFMLMPSSLQVPWGWRGTEGADSALAP